MSGGWSESVDPDSGRTFYYNASGETSWEPPLPAQQAQEQPLPEGWASATDPGSGRTFWYNGEGETSWERPAGSSASKYCYVDDDSVMQGPFEASLMQQWFSQSLFPDETLVCRYGEAEAQYHPISEVFGGAGADDSGAGSTSRTGAAASVSGSRRRSHISGSAPEAIEKVLRTLEGLKKLALMAAQESKFSSGYKAGWLVKRARTGKGNWRKRHCTLSGEKLTYAESEGGRAKGFIAITAATDIKLLEGKDVGQSSVTENRFFSVSGDGEETLVLQAASSAEARSWVAAVSGVVKKLMGIQGGSLTLFHLASEMQKLESFAQGMECDKGLAEGLTERISTLQRRCGAASAEVRRGVDDSEAYAQEALRKAKAGVAEITMRGVLKRRDQGKRPHEQR